MYHPNATCTGGEREARNKLPCREEERETCEVERNQMEAQPSSGGKWMRSRGNGGGQPPVAAQSIPTATYLSRQL